MCVIPNRWKGKTLLRCYKLLNLGCSMFEKELKKWIHQILNVAWFLVWFFVVVCLGFFFVTPFVFTIYSLLSPEESLQSYMQVKQKHDFLLTASRKPAFPFFLHKVFMLQGYSQWKVKPHVVWLKIDPTRLCCNVTLMQPTFNSCDSCKATTTLTFTMQLNDRSQCDIHLHRLHTV